MDEDEHSDEMDAEVDDSPVELTLEEKETLLKNQDGMSFEFRTCNHYVHIVACSYLHRFGGRLLF